MDSAIKTAPQADVLNMPVSLAREPPVQATTDEA
jgi:hypothetical protein